MVILKKISISEYDVLFTELGCKGFNLAKTIIIPDYETFYTLGDNNGEDTDIKALLVVDDAGLFTFKYLNIGKSYTRSTKRLIEGGIDYTFSNIITDGAGLEIFQPTQIIIDLLDKTKYNYTTLDNNIIVEKMEK